MLEPLGGRPLDTSPRRSSKKIVIIVLSIILPLIGSFVTVAVIVGVLLLGPKTTDEYACAMSELKKNKKVAETLGEPWEAGFFAFGNFSIRNGTRRVSFQTSLTGTRRSGTLHVSSSKDSNDRSLWMMLEADGQKTQIYSGDFSCR